MANIKELSQLPERLCGGHRLCGGCGASGCAAGSATSRHDHKIGFPQRGGDLFG